MHVAEAKRVLGSGIPWIADNMANEIKHALGNRQNSEYLLDPDGRILRVRAWSDPDQLRRDLAEFVGSVENPTEVSELNMRIRPAPEHAQTGVVPRIEKPGTYRTLVSRPQLAKTDEPFYTKLRAEADQELLRSGEGKLYLAFLLDPLHGVHWNNLAPAMDVELSAPEGVRITPAKLQGPKVEEDADADPREFLVHVKRGDSQEPLGMRFRYFACTDTWCRPGHPRVPDYLGRRPRCRAGQVRPDRFQPDWARPGRGRQTWTGRWPERAWRWIRPSAVRRATPGQGRGWRRSLGARGTSRANATELRPHGHGWRRLYRTVGDRGSDAAGRRA